MSLTILEPAVTATLNGLSKSATLKVRPIGVSALSLSPSSLAGGSGHTSIGKNAMDPGD